ncbi:MAG: cation:proton antiporter, partial [Steroidobacteraceae bacterium]
GGMHVVIQEMAAPIGLIVLALTLARFAWVFGSDGVIALQRKLGIEKFKPVGPRGATVLSWAGMRGVVTLAVALSVPASLPGRDFMLVTAFAVILVTVVLQGMTLGLVIRWTRPKEAAVNQPRLSMSQAEASMARAQLQVVEVEAYDGEGKLNHPMLLERYRRRAHASENYAGDEAQYQPLLHAHYQLVLKAVAAGRAELLRLHRAGEIDERTLQELERDLDIEELGAVSAMAT